MPLGTALPALLPESSGSTVVHLAPTDGNDTTGDGSAGNPYRTLNKALTLAGLGPGYIIRLYGDDGLHGAGGPSGEGTNITVISKFGSLADPITIEPVPGTGRPIIDGTRIQFNPGDLKQNDYNGGNGLNLRIRGLEWRNAPGTGQSGFEAIRLHNARNMEISDCWIHDNGFCGIQCRGMGRDTSISSGAMGTGDTAITVASAANFLNAVPFFIGITNSTGAAGSWDEVTEICRVDSVGAGTNWTIARAQLGTSAVAHVANARVVGMWQAQNVQIFNNRIYSNGKEGTPTNWAASHSHGIYYGPDAGTLGGAIYNNLIYDNASFGITLHEFTDGCIVACNTIDQHNRGALNIAAEITHGCKNNRVKGNILTNSLDNAPLSGSSQSGFAVNVWFESAIYSGVGSSDNVVDRNVIFANANGYHTSDSGDHPAGSVTFSESGQGVVKADPLYANRAGKDFRVRGDSPARGIGEEQYTPRFDFAGVERGGPDAGAYAITPAGRPAPVRQPMAGVRV